MSKAVAIKPEEDFARSYVDSLILEKLTEMDSTLKLGELAEKLSVPGVGLSTVRSLLASKPELFAYHERRWVPNTRLQSQGRPLHEAIRLFLQAFRRPVSLATLVRELARIRHQDLTEIEHAIRRLIEKSEAFVLSQRKEVALTEWSFMAHDESVERAFALNGISNEEVEAAQATLKSIQWREDDAVRKAPEKAAPTRLKVLGAVAWLALNNQDSRATLVFDAVAFFKKVLDTEGFLIASDGVVYPEAEIKKWVAAAVKVADKIAPTLEVEEAAPIEVASADVQKLVNAILQSPASTTATKLLEEFYDITSAHKTFPDDFENVMNTLKEQSSIVWVGGDRFRKADDIPDFIQTLPEPFAFTTSNVLDDEGESVDVELTDDGLSSSLRKLLAHPLATDVFDEDIQPAPKTMPESLRLVLKHIHRELGTFPLCQVPTGWLDSDPRIQELIFIDSSGRELQVWVNMETRLMYNLIDWWYEQPVESGAVFTVTKTNRPNVLDFTWLDQPDPVVYISTQRMEELREIARNSEGKSTFELLTEVMEHWPKGADFLTLLAEINVVRRSTRRLIASLLSSYLCFYQRSGSPVWHYDPKKVEQGFDKTKRKFVKK